jgi:hypothetical protein
MGEATLNLYDNNVPGEDLPTSKSSTMPPADDKQWIDRFKNAKKSATDHQTSKLQTAWARNYRAFSNRHFDGSKYETLKFRSRSKLFKPKTRAAVRKNDATAAQSMFSTEDVVSITAERTSDKLQATTARFLHEDLNYRLDRNNKWAGPSWFLTAIGARQDTQLTGICVSKQYWEYEERTISQYVDVQTQTIALDATGMPIVDLTTGQPVMQPTVEQGVQDKVEVMRDRLMITLFPPEHALIDPTADWRDPIQEGGFFIAAYPMRIDDVEDIIAQQAERNILGGKAWRADVDITQLRQAKTDRSDQASAVRRARNDGIDRYEGAFKGRDNETVWLYECFYRCSGEDWHYWMLGDTTLLSDPRPTIESYPEQDGGRPYVRGLGALETHKTNPMAPVESWQPIQMEINDTTNLYLDAMKMGISPITKIVKGRGVDLKQVQNRGPDAAIQVQAADDVTFDRAPSPDGNAQMAVNVLSNDMDELAGVFSNGSVQSNRMLNETVGGMQMLSASANALTEFDLRVWVETWVEPVLAQCIRLIKHYESDDVVIAVAGEKAGLIENIVAGQPPSQGAPQDASQGLDPNKQEANAQQDANPFEPPITLAQVLGNLDKAQVTVKVNVGIGALDTTQRMQKFMGGVQITKDMAPLLADQGIEVNGAAILQEAWGLCGYKDADRFFTKKKQVDQGPPPEAQLEMLKQKGAMDKATLASQTSVQIEQIKASLQAKEISLQEREFEQQQMMARIELAMQQQAVQAQQQQQNLTNIMELLKHATAQQSAQATAQQPVAQ